MRPIWEPPGTTDQVSLVPLALSSSRCRLAAWSMRLIRLAVATTLLPAAAFIAFQVAIRFNGDSSVIDTAGNVVAIAVLIVLLLGISRLAADGPWVDRAGTAVGLAVAYFTLTWVLYGDPGRSIDEAPHLVWLGTSIVAFSPAVVIMPAVRWAWNTYFENRASANPV